MLFNDADMKDEERKEYKKVQSVALQIVDEFDGCQKHNKSNLDLGLCIDCENLEYVETRWGKYFAKCSYLDIRLTTTDPVERCNKHKPVGVMDLSDMWNIYTPISAGKRKAGF